MTDQTPDQLADFWADTDPDENQRCQYSFIAIAQCERRAEWLVRIYGHPYLVCEEHRGQS